MIHLLCALKCEAKPIIQHFNLTYYNKASLFPVYLNKEATLSMTISGTGKTAAAAAVIHTSILLDSSRTDVWLNTGIAGHQTIPAGKPVLANKIIDHGSGHCWYPQILFQIDIPSATVLTVDSPATDYSDSMLLDMEAAGYYQSISRIASAELCHSLKIVSDNEAAHQNQINASYVSQLISANLSHIDTLMSILTDLADTLMQSTKQRDEDYRHIVSRWHFSRTQRTYLLRLLNRWQIICPDIPVFPDHDSSHWQDSRTILEDITARLDRTPIKFSHDKNR